MKHIIKDTLANVRQTINKARGLPNDFYTSQEVFAYEKENFFFKGWFAVCSRHKLSVPGAVYPITFFDLPLLVVRDKDDVIRVFQNTCRHRGMILVDEPTKTNGIVRCPYHSWCYSLSGELRISPHVGGPGKNVHEDMCKEDLGLFSFRCQEYMGVVFVNISGDAPDFEEYIGSLKKKWHEFQRPLYYAEQDSSFTLNIDCNWKLAVENYCESYHLPWVHPGLNSYSRLEDHYDIIDEEGHRFSGQGTHFYQPTVGEDGKKFDIFPALSSQWDKAAEYIALYPNVLFGVHKDHVFSIVLQPISESKTCEHIDIYYASEEMVSDEWKEKRKANCKLWKDIFEEDIFVVEGMQRGRYGPLFDGGKFSPAMDNATHFFHRWVVSRV